MLRLLLISLFAFVAGATGATDFAQGTQRDAWLSHPVYGEASFDTFVHAPGNPIDRGKAPYDWPVNGFLFEDPASGNWYVYVGHYARNYSAEVPMRCTVSRSTDRGATWEDLGAIFPDASHTFTGEQSPEGHAPDVSVLYADGKYHLVYDWLTESTLWGDIFNPDATHNSGVGYAWAERPEGPFHRSATPVWTTRDQPSLAGKYRRQYASTLIRRANDWLVLTLTDSGPNFGWAYLGRSAKTPEGPWSEATLLLHPERDVYHPPLLEFHPSFAHDGYVYAPATSVALNRNVQALFRAPLEHAMDPDAWELHQMGSLWHAEPVEHEYDGIWGQAFSGFVGADGLFNVFFPSRDSGGFGTVNLASRPWAQPFTTQGFVVSAHQGPSLALLKRAGVPEYIGADLSIHGTVRLLWAANMPLGPDAPRSDATLHRLTRSRFNALELSAGAWRLLRADEAGEIEVLQQGERGTGELASVELAWDGTQKCTLTVDGHLAWSGTLAAQDGSFALLLEPRSHARVTSLRIEGDLRAATRNYLWSEGVLGAAQRVDHWTVEREPEKYVLGEGAVSDGTPVSAKWSVEGTSLVIYAPRGPDYGRASVTIDGRDVGEIDYRAAAPESSAPRFSIALPEGRHGITLTSIEGRVPLDTLKIAGN